MSLILYLIYIYVLCTINSPYLLVFGDDRVRGTWEQMMLQVDLMTHRARAWAISGIFYKVYYLMEFKDFVINWIIECSYCIRVL